jgi:diguanylate cyclase (GGDEF)-like protein/PAS domain S-box-containing protein
MSILPPVFDAERKRLQRLRELGVLDTAPEPLFDLIARIASEACGVPIALLSLVDEERQWFKANVGLPGITETPRDIAFCAHAIASDALFEVPDATLDARFANNPLVTTAPDIRFYAGAPLLLPDGERVGTLCVLDRQPGHLSAAQATTLRQLAAIASEALVARRDLLQRALQARSHYERALAASEGHYRKIVEEQAEMVSLADADGVLVYVNPAYARHFGRTPDELIGVSLFDLVDPADRPAVQAHIAAVLRSAVAAASENRMVAADGSERWVAWSNAVQSEPSGQVLLHSVGRDVTVRKRLELALLANESLLRRTGRVAGVGGWELDLVSGALWWSDETRRIHEVASDYVPALDTAIAFYAPVARAAIEAAVQQGMAQGTPWDLELPLVTAKGRPLWVRAVGEVEFDAGKSVRLIGAFQDITQRKQLELRLEDSEGFVRLVTDNLPVRIAYIDAGHRYRFVNRAHCQRFGLEREEIEGRTTDDLLGSDGLEVDSRVAAVLGGMAQHFESVEESAGRRRVIESRLLPDRAASGEVRGFFSTGIDITERKALELRLAESAGQVQDLYDNAPCGYYSLDAAGRFIRINRVALAWLGCRDDEAIGTLGPGDFLSDADKLLFERSFASLKQNGQSGPDEFELGSRDGTQRWVSVAATALRDEAGGFVASRSVMYDISEVHRARAELRRLNLEQHAMLDNDVVGIVRLRDRVVVWKNRALDRMFGYGPDELIGQPARLLFSDDATFNRIRSEGRAALTAGGHWRGQVQMVRKNGALIWIDLNGVALSPESGESMWLMTDITALKEQQAQVEHIAFHDALTGLPNRLLLADRMQQALALGERLQGSVAVCYLDLDGFKEVNDHHGHEAGDRLLKEIAARLLRCVRSSDTVSRLGGDEFALLLTPLGHSDACAVVLQRIVAAIQEPVLLDGGSQATVSASIGVSFFPEHGHGASQLLMQADAAMYAAKRAGKNRVAYFAATDL